MRLEKPADIVGGTILGFDEKLQQLRKENHLTQEQLAEKLYVSRTAISKWENGKGYPNIDSLKCISELFDRSIDDLLSNDELAEVEKRGEKPGNVKAHALVYGSVDLAVAAFLMLPLFSQREGGAYLLVPLLDHHSTPWIVACSYVFVMLLSAVGMLELSLPFRKNQKLQWRTNLFSMTINALAVLFFIATRQLYVSTFLFLFIFAKGFILVKSGHAE